MVFGTGSGRWSGAAVSFGLATMAFVQLRRRPNRRIWRNGVLLLAGFLTLIVFGTGADAHAWPKPWPILILGWYLTGLLAMAMAFFIRQSEKPVVATLILATGAAGTLGLIVPSQLRQPPVRYFAGRSLPDKPLTYRLGPRCVYRNYYPDNPRGYFDEEPYEQPWQRLWQVQSTEPVYAELRLPVKPGGPLRVDVESADPDDPWLAQMVHAPIKRPPDGVVQVSLQLRADKEWECLLAISDAVDRHRSLCSPQSLAVGSEWRTYSFARSVLEAEDMIVTLALAGQAGRVEMAACQFAGSDGQPLPSAAGNITRYSVEYRTNSMGFRTREITGECSKETFRMIAVGDSFTFGQGVHAADTLAARLEERLQQIQPSGRFRNYEVYNLGRCGYSVREERLVFEQMVDGIDPRVLLLVLCVNDARADDAPPVDRNLPSHPPIPNVEECLREIDALAESCRRRNIGFAFVLFRVTPAIGFTRTWMTRLDEYAKKSGLAYLELGDILLGKYAGSQLMVHETDGHPNELAHRRAAEAILKLLVENDIVR